MSRRFPISAISLLLITGCGERQDGGTITASAIGSAPVIVDPSRKALPFPSAVLLGAIAQGLVRFDGTGQIEPGLAIRWDVSDDGLYYTFRLATGSAIDAESAAQQLRTAIGRTSANPLRSLSAAIDEIVAVTPEVIEIRLAAPQPNLLELLAQPELALIHDGSGTGPLAITVHEPRSLTLAPAVAPDAEDSSDQRPEQSVRLRGERAALAIARFGAGQTDLVIGGSFADLAIARAARPSARTLRFDPVAGLFGLAVVEPKGFLASAENRRALSLAIDRNAIAAAFPDSGWHATDTLAPSNTPELPMSRPPDWLTLSHPLRRQIAGGIVRLWTGRNDAPPRIRVAIPDGPGARLLFSLLASSWRGIGVAAIAVPLSANADLRLIDAVAPSNSAVWYLSQFSCAASPVCSESADEALAAADRAQTAADRAARLAEADAALAQVIPFLPIAQPIRWSLVSPRLTGFTENARAIHPLNHLIEAPR